MEQKDKITKPNWALIEAIAFRVYPNEASVLTRDDIEEIEEGIENNSPIETDEDEGGDMDFPIALTIAAFSLGLAAIQTVINYMSWKYPHAVPRPAVAPITNQATAKDFVGHLLDDDEFGKTYREEIKTELLKRRQTINTILEQMYPDEAFE